MTVSERIATRWVLLAITLGLAAGAVTVTTPGADAVGAVTPPACPIGERLQRVTGDWDGDGDDTPGVVDRHGNWNLRNSASDGSPDICFTFGVPGDRFVVGDWDGDGTDSVAAVSSSGGSLWWHLRDGGTRFRYGRTGETPVAGNWDGTGGDSVGVVRRESGGRLRWLLREQNSSGAPDHSYLFGEVPAVPGLPRTDVAYRLVPGDWDGDGVDTPGYLDPGEDGVWHWRLRTASGRRDVPFGAIAGDLAATGFVRGDWDGRGSDDVGITYSGAALGEGDWSWSEVRWSLGAASPVGEGRDFSFGWDALRVSGGT